MHRPTRESVGWSVVAKAILFEESKAMLKTHRRNGPMIVTLGVALVIAIQPAQAENWQLTVRGTELNLGETPVALRVETAIPVGLYVLQAGDQNETVRAQVFQEGDHRSMALVLTAVAARQVATYTLKRLPDGDSGPATGISFRTEGSNVVVALNQRLFTEYHVDAGHKPFFFPMVGPTGDSYTRAYPMESVAGEDRDHPHQRSCWFTFGNVNGIDFWGESKESGKIRETTRQMIVAGPVIGRMRTKDEWLAPDGRKILDDERHVTFYNTKTARIIDFDIKLEATSGPVTFNDTKEGMFGLRMASTMDVNKRTGGKITNAEGLTDEKAWGQPSPWVDYIGPVHEKTVGIAVLNRPDSFRYPTTWHVRTYGLFAANPFGWHDFGNSLKGDFSLPAGQSISFHYRVILHEGDTKGSALPQLFAAYATHLGVELKGD
jgi:Methane oxygenase PmoA